MINWFARNGVAANLLMLIFVVGGFGSLLSLKRELFPQFSLGLVTISVPYLGASPEEVETGVILRIEEALQGVDGIKEINASAVEGFGRVTVEVRKGYPIEKLKDSIKTRVDAISSFPAQTERPVIEELLIDRDVIWLSIYGDTDEVALRGLAERARDELVELNGISQVRLNGVREYEISIELSQHALMRYGLTFDAVVQRINSSSIDLPGGRIRADNGEILLRTQQQAYSGEEFGELVLLSRPDGTELLLRDVAEIRDGFVDNPLIAEFNGQPAAFLLVSEVGDEDPIDIATKAKAYAADAQANWLPEGISIDAWGDSSFYLQGRLNILISNGLVGLALVMTTLALFLRPSLAFFVALGIPVSFLGTFLIAPFADISINLISLFAFILVLGIVVDDAIIVGESVFTEFQKKGPGLDSAIRGAHRVSVPVTYAILTTIVAFFPVLLLPGLTGKFFREIPLVVIPTLIFSLIQSKLVLPYHLSLLKVGTHQRKQLGWLARAQRWVADRLESFVGQFYQPALDLCLRFRYATLTVFVAIFAITLTMVSVGLIRFVQFPEVPSDFIDVELRMPEGTSFEQTQAAHAQLEAAIEGLRADYIAEGKPDPVKHSLSFVGSDRSSQGSNLAYLVVELSKSELRDASAYVIAEAWRERVGVIPGVRDLKFTAGATGPTGLPVDVLLTGPDFNELQAAAQFLKGELGEFAGLYDIRDTYAEGKQEVQVKLLPNGVSLGLTAASVGQQIRSAFFGAEAQRLQRGRNEVKVMVRLPEGDRESLENLYGLRIPLADGSSVPLSAVARLEMGEGFPMIQRIDRQRSINVQADADKDIADLPAINTLLYGEYSTELEQRFPSVSIKKRGEARDWEEIQVSLISGGILVATLIYALLAVPFKSYLQPLIVMAIIPFGITGAILGHMITGQPVSMLSILGIIALTGIVVNDSLVLVDFINRERAETGDLLGSVMRAGAARFRPILLTSMTTFVGLVPVLLEKSLQAQFLIPMATSLAFGVLFTTFITLLLVPACYLILSDFTLVFRKTLSVIKKWCG